MGVWGLSTFIKNNCQIFRDIRFKNSKLIIDGCNLYYLLYFNTDLEQNYGGEYDAFDDLITKFVKALRDCGIEPYVVLDGRSVCCYGPVCYDIDVLEERFRKAHIAAMGGKENILPLLVNLVFKQTLTNLKVPFAQCFGKADSQIASLAREWRCPVLSNDSDFYIFDLPGGFLPISHFNWDAVSQSGSRRYIPCKYYITSSFCVYFNIKIQLLPVMAALGGNDYVKLHDMGLSLRWAKYSREGSRFDGIVRWLKNFQSPDDALTAVLGLMVLRGLSTQREAEVLQALTLGMEAYQFLPTCLVQFFNDGTAPDLEPEAVGIVPDWARLPLTRGRLTADILGVLLNGSVVLPCQVDLAHLPSANITSRPIRQVTYGLLLGSKTGTSVEEWDREGTQLSETTVGPIVRGVAQKLKLDLLHQAEQSVLERVFLETLGVSHSSLKRVPENLRLPVAVTCYWLQHCRPPPDKKVIQALLLGMVAGEMNRQGLKHHIKNHRHKLDLGVAHAYNQWQVCLKDSIHLNQLLCFPLPEPQIAWLYKGTLVHYLVHRLRLQGADTDQLLQRKKATSRPLYKTLLTAMLQSQEDVVSTTPTRRRGAAPKQHPPVDDLTANLDVLRLLEEDLEKDGRRGDTVTQEEHSGWDSVSVKTRYKAKDSGQRPKNPELSRKQGHVAW